MPKSPVRETASARARAMRGAYVVYSPELAREVCALLGQGYSLSRVGRLEGLPSFTTLLRWRRTHPQFQAMYLEACARRPAGRGPRGPYGTKAEIAARRAARPAPGPPGRPSPYCAELAQEICRRIAAGAGMLDLRDQRDLPSLDSINGWLAEHEDFRRLYGAACEQRAQLLADEVVVIADDASGDFMPARDGKGLIPNPQAIRRAQLMIDARKWRAARLAPRKYGLSLSGEDAPSGGKTHEDWLAELEGSEP